MFNMEKRLFVLEFFVWKVVVVGIAISIDGIEVVWR